MLISFFRIDDIHYYHGNHLLPVYAYPKKGYKKEQIVHILLDPKFDKQYLCDDHPTLVENNVAFVVNLSKLNCKDDVRADDLGTWVCTGSRVLKLNVEILDDICSIVTCNDNSYNVSIRRQYHVHSTDPDLHRMIAFVEGKCHISESRCLVQYWFKDGDEHPVKIRSHGNAKCKVEPFCRTHSSSLAALKAQGESSSPKAAIQMVYSDKGGIMKAASLSQLPRNRQQVSNIRRSVGFQVPLCSKKGLNDPLLMVMQQSKLCGDSFVRTVTVPMCILTTDQQLKDLERFTTNASLFSIVSVDPTFSLGDFSVTCIVYRHLIKDRRTGESPIMLGPILVHQRKLFETYHFFISSLIRFAPSLDHILAFGRDGEEALAVAHGKCGQSRWNF